MDAFRNSFCGMQRKAHGAQQPRHIKWIGEVASIAQRGEALAKWIYGGIL
jgi:hypothetical protein